MTGTMNRADKIAWLIENEVVRRTDDARRVVDALAPTAPSRERELHWFCDWLESEVSREVANSLRMILGTPPPTDVEDIVADLVERPMDVRPDVLHEEDE